MNYRFKNFSLVVLLVALSCGANSFAASSYGDADFAKRETAVTELMAEFGSAEGFTRNVAYQMYDEGQEQVQRQKAEKAAEAAYARAIEESHCAAQRRAAYVPFGGFAEDVRHEQLPLALLPNINWEAMLNNLQGATDEAATLPRGFVEPTNMDLLQNLIVQSADALEIPQGGYFGAHITQFIADIKARLSEKNQPPLFFVTIPLDVEIMSAIMAAGYRVDIADLSKMDNYELNIMLPFFLNKSSESNDSPLHQALQAKNPEIIEALIANPCIDLNVRNHAGDSPLHAVIKMRMIDNAFALIANPGVDLNARDGESGGSPLHLAINMARLPFKNYLDPYEGYESDGGMIYLALALIKNPGVRVNDVNLGSETPLHRAIRCYIPEIGMGGSLIFPDPVIIDALLARSDLDFGIYDTSKERALDLANSMKSSAEVIAKIKAKMGPPRW